MFLGLVVQFQNGPVFRGSVFSQVQFLDDALKRGLHALHIEHEILILRISVNGKQILSFFIFSGFSYQT